MKTSIQNLRKPFLFVATALFLASCCCEYFNPRSISGRGDVVLEVHEMESFNRIAASLGAEINIYESQEHRIEISMQENLHDVFEAEVKNGRLNISFGNYNVRSRKDIIIDIFASEVHEFLLSGAGDVYSELGISDISISGAGDVQCFGEVDELTISLSGAGNFNLYELYAQKVKVRISGSGDVKVYAEEELDVRISGVGSVYYKGKPRVTQSISGVGKVVDDN